MEAASENHPKRRRGRPPKPTVNSAGVHPDCAHYWKDQPKQLVPLCDSQATTLRGCQNAEYALRASVFLFELKDEFPDVLKLIGIAIENGKQVANPIMVKRNLGILAELGRVCVDLPDDGPGIAAEFVEHLLKQDPRPTSKETALRIRRWRLQELGRPVMKAIGDRDGVRVAIIAAINAYMQKNPGTSDCDVVMAMEDALAIVAAKAETS